VPGMIESQAKQSKAQERERWLIKGNEHLDLWIQLELVAIGHLPELKADQFQRSQLYMVVRTNLII
jgi:hypothetical protein